jgi:hypothetical protein
MNAPLTKDDLVRAVHNLNSRTRDRDLVWRVCSPPGGVLSVLSEAKAYCANYQENVIRIVATATTTLGAATDRSTYKLQIMDGEEKRVLYEFPSVQGIADLWFTVQISIGEVESVLRSLAGKE